jgi:hypothetical protein
VIKICCNDQNITKIETNSPSMCIETTFMFDLARKAINLRTDNKMAKINRKGVQTVIYKTQTTID